MKQKQLCRTLTAAAVLTAAMAIPAFASGWEQTTDGTWVYTDSSGSYVTDSWKKSGDYYFYLGDDGTLVTDSLIEDDGYYYYVDENGAMVTNRWVKLESTDDDDTDADYRWYYFGANGRAYQDTSSPKEINGKKYMFDEEGRMLYGFVNEEGEMLTDDDAALDATYYFGTADDGTMYTGWLQVTEDLTDESYDDYDEIWMYFGSNGEKYADSTKTINGNKYSFDENGIMNYGWTDASSTASSSNVSSTKYYSTAADGHLQKNTWIYAIPSEDVNEDDYEDGTYRWFYANSSGYIVSNQAKKINSRWYVFDEDGIMQYGLVVMNDDSISSSSNQYIVSTLDEDEVTAEDIYEMGDAAGGDLNLFYFSSGESDGAMKKGTTVSIELADDTYTFGFASNGKAYNGIESKKYYKYGILQKADSDDKYALVEATEGKYVLVNTAGTVVTSGTVKDGDGNYYAFHNGTIGYFAENDLASKAATAYKNGSFTFSYDGDTYVVSDYLTAEYTEYTE